MRPVLSSLAAAMLLASSAAATAITAEQLVTIKIGSTTYDEVVAKFGKPATTEQSSDGSRAVVYTSIKSHVKAASYLPVVGLFAGGASAQTAVYRFEFGPDGVLSKTSTTDTAIDCKMFGGCGSR